MKMRRLALALAGACMVACTHPASANERSATRHDFVASERKAARVIVYRPHIVVGEQSTAGMFEPRADWTDQARENLHAAVDAAQASLGHMIVLPPEMTAEEARLLASYQVLFEAVSNSIIDYQFFAGNRLETKKQDNRENVFDWSLGTGVASLPGADRADYALFLNTTDHYGSTGRKVLQVLAAASVGVGVTSGLHAGYAGLVDLKTGNIVWINADHAMGGDVRTAEGATKRMGQLLEEFPLAPAIMAGAQVAAQ
jgi:hypothetical protein